MPCCLGTTITIVSYQRSPVSGSISLATSATCLCQGRKGTRPISSDAASTKAPRVGLSDRAVPYRGRTSCGRVRVSIRYRVVLECAAESWSPPRRVLSAALSQCFQLVEWRRPGLPRDSIYEQAEYRTLPPSRGAADLSRSLLLYSVEVSMESKRSRPRGSPSSSLSFPQDGCPGSPRLMAPHPPDSSLFSRGHSSPGPWFSLTVRAAQLGH